MNTVECHPPKDQLVAFGLGKLEDAAVERIAKHLSHCKDCGDNVFNSEDDPFVALVRNAPACTPVAAASISGESQDAEQVAGNSETGMHRTSPLGELPLVLREHPRYEIVGLLGRGGMGDVYKANHRMMDRTVAIKIINRELVRKPDVVDRFHREIKAVAKLSHPNVVAAHDAEQAGDVHFLVMEYVDGVDLSHTVKDRGSLPIAEACEYARQVAVGLQYAIERGMVHRDIKPHNLMVTADGTVKILDFGLASLAPATLSEDDTVEFCADLTAAGAIMGTPDFISPEQVDDAHQADIRSDIYSLGSTLYFLLAGRPPFSDLSVMQKLAVHERGEAKPLESVRDDIPAGLAAVVARMIAANPDDRLQTPADVVLALMPFFVVPNAEGATKEPARSTSNDRQLHWPQNKSSRLSFSWMQAALTLAVIGVAMLLLFQEPQSEVNAPQTPPKVEAKVQPWRFHDPIVVQSEDVPDGRSFLWSAPTGIVHAGEVTVLGSMRGIKHNPALDLWIERGDRSWQRFCTIQGVNWPKVFSIGSGVGVVGSVGTDASGGYGNTIKYYRVSADGKVQEPVEVARPAAAEDRMTISSVHVREYVVSVFLLLEKRGQEKNQLLYVRSADGGRTWAAPQSMGETTMHEDGSRLGSFQWSENHLGRFVVEKDRSILLYESQDAGRSWKTKKIILRDELGDAATRIPLASVQTETGESIVYLGTKGGPGFGFVGLGRGKYYFSSSSDHAKTWRPGVAITKWLMLEDPSTFAQLAVSGDRVALSYVEVKGKWTKGEMECRLALSTNGGDEWNHVPLEKYYRGVALLSALAVDQSGSRILFSTSICLDPKTDKRNYLTIQEFSSRIPPREPAPTTAERREMEALIEQLGAESFEDREKATRRLAAFGRVAKNALIEAAESEDPEIKLRAKNIMYQIFPKCLRFDVEN